MKKLYLAVTNDKYELPVAVADTPEGLAEMMHVSARSVLSVISHAKQHKRRCMYQRIEYSDHEWNL